MSAHSSLTLTSRVALGAGIVPRRATGRRNPATPGVPFRSTTPVRTIASSSAPMTRNDVTELVVFNRMKKGITWASLAEACGKSVPWTTSALLGQHQMSPEQATTAGKMLDLPDDAVMLLSHVPYKGTGSIPAGQTVPTDPLIYRFYEMVMVYGSTYKELIHEEFGDGIMSAIDFDMDFGRLADPNGDRVTITLTGKYLKYKQF